MLSTQPHHTTSTPTYKTQSKCTQTPLHHHITKPTYKPTPFKSKTTKPPTTFLCYTTLSQTILAFAHLTSTFTLHCYPHNRLMPQVHRHTTHRANPRRYLYITTSQNQHTNPHHLNPKPSSHPPHISMLHYPIANHISICTPH